MQFRYKNLKYCLLECKFRRRNIYSWLIENNFHNLKISVILLSSKIKVVSISHIFADNMLFRNTWIYLYDACFSNPNVSFLNCTNKVKAFVKEFHLSTLKPVFK